VQERAVLLGELVDGAVRERADEVEVADDRPRRRAWREVVYSAGLGFEFAQDEGSCDRQCKNGDTER
jgi:hypothetical protein